MAKVLSAQEIAKQLIIKALAGQATNLQEWQDSAGTILNRITSNGMMQFQDVVAEKIRLFANYGIGINSGELSLWANNLPAGMIGIRSNTVSGPRVIELYVGIGAQAPATRAVVKANDSGTRGLVVQGATAQTANLQEWQNVSGVPVALVSPAGRLEARERIVMSGGSPGIGKLMTSDADGLASWEQPKIFVQPTNPLMAGPGLWVQTQIGPGNDISFWVEDGVPG